MTREESILPIKRYRPDCSFDGVSVDLDAAVSQEAAKAIPVFIDICQCFAKGRLASNASPMLAQPGPHVGDQRR